MNDLNLNIKKNSTNSTCSISILFWLSLLSFYPLFLLLIELSSLFWPRYTQPGLYRHQYFTKPGRRVRGNVDRPFMPDWVISNSYAWGFYRTTEWTFFWGNSGMIQGWHIASTLMIPWTWTHPCWTPFGNQIYSLPMRRVPTSMMSPPTTNCFEFQKMAKYSTVSGKLLLAAPVYFIFLLAWGCLIPDGKTYINIWLLWSLGYHLNLKIGENATGSHGLGNVILHNKNIFGKKYIYIFGKMVGGYQVNTCIRVVLIASIKEVQAFSSINHWA